MTRAVSQDDFLEGIGGEDSVGEFLDDIQDSGSLTELFETGSCTVTTPMGKLEIAITISRTD